MTDVSEISADTAPVVAASEPIVSPTGVDTLLAETPPEDIKPSESAVDEVKEDAKEDAKEAVKPIEYTDFTLPEGVKPDDTILTEFKTLAAESGLSQESAQKLVNLYGDQIKTAVEAPYTQWRALQDEWREAIKTDPELGGVKMESLTQSIAKTIDTVMGDKSGAVRDAFNMTGAGNNPEIVRFIYRLSQAVTEGAPVSGNPMATAPKSRSDTLYGKPAGLANGHPG